MGDPQPQDGYDLVIISLLEDLMTAVGDNDRVAAPRLLADIPELPTSQPTSPYIKRW